MHKKQWHEISVLKSPFLSYRQYFLGEIDGQLNCYRQDRNERTSSNYLNVNYQGLVLAWLGDLKEQEKVSMVLVVYLRKNGSMQDREWV